MHLNIQTAVHHCIYVNYKVPEPPDTTTTLKSLSLWCVWNTARCLFIYHDSDWSNRIAYCFTFFFTFRLLTAGLVNLVQFAVQLILSVNDDLLLLLLLHLLVEYAPLELLESLHLVVPLRKLLDRVLVLLLKESLQIVTRKLRALQLVDLRLWQIDDLSRESIAKDLVVHIVRSIIIVVRRKCVKLLFSNRENVTLRDVVFDPEVPIIEYAAIIEGELFRE